MLTTETYHARRDALQADLTFKRAEYEVESLAALDDPKRAGARSRLRNDVADIEEQLRDLDAAWEAAERQREASLTEEAARERADAVTAARGALQRAEALGAEIDQACDHLLALLAQVRDEQSATQRAVARHLSERGRDEYWAFLSLAGASEIGGWLGDLSDAATGGGARRQSVATYLRGRVAGARSFLTRHFPTVPPEEHAE